MSDKLKEFKCDTCLNLCILMVHANDCAPDACPYSCVNFKKWGAVEITTPKHETVSQWESRRLPDRSRKCIVWRYGEDPREMLFNHHGAWQVVGDYEKFHSSHFTHWIYMPLSPNHYGKPELTDD